MNWPYKHGTRGTCNPRCKMYGLCHCGCGDKTKVARAKSRRWGQDKGEPYVFLNHHHKPAQWGEPRRMADCHPEKVNHSRGLCAACHWQKHKRAMRPENQSRFMEWERLRYRRFLDLVNEGLDIAPALRQLEHDVPSELEELAQ